MLLVYIFAYFYVLTYLFYIEFFDSIFFRFRVFSFGSFTTALLVSQSLLFTFQCAFMSISFEVERMLLYYFLFQKSTVF